jgi:hypothetical protein
MPSVKHEAIVQLLHRNPRLAACLLDCMGYPVPAGPVALADSNLPHPEPKELRSDVVVTVRSGGRAVLAIVAEPQTSMPGRKKRRAWLAYLAVAGIAHDCDAVLMPIAADPGIARRCALPFQPGHPGLKLVPLVSHAGNTPSPGTVGAWRAGAELAVLGALNGALNLADARTRRLVLDQLAGASLEDRQVYTRIIYLTAGPAVRKALEADMAITDYRIEFFDRPLEEARAEGEARGRAEGEARGRAEGEARGRAEGEARGRAEGEAWSLLRVLAARGFDVPDDTRDQVMSCTDTTQLNQWLDKAATARTLTEVFR